MSAERRARAHRTTKETDVEVEIDLDGRGSGSISTGIGFLDHMLDAFSRHSRFDLMVRAAGDLGVDAHHTVEDVALVLGQAINEALGNRNGIERFADAAVPMDDSLALVAIDCGGRGHAVIDIDFGPDAVGTLPASLLAHFLEVLARSASMNLHLKARGADNHHIAEACFKALARALRQASRIDHTISTEVPSTKGVL